MNPKLKRQVWERDNYQCQGCGSCTVDTAPHHIIYKSQGGRDQSLNLVTLCRTCHTEAHSTRKERERWEEWVMGKGVKWCKWCREWHTEEEYEPTVDDDELIATGYRCIKTGKVL